MKLAKKITTFFAAAVIAVSAMMPFAASAESWRDKDPNMDGRLEIADAVVILQCLIGVYQPVDMNQLDVTCNGIVSQADVDFVFILDSRGEIPIYVQH